MVLVLDELAIIEMTVQFLRWFVLSLGSFNWKCQLIYFWVELERYKLSMLLLALSPETLGEAQHMVVQNAQTLPHPYDFLFEPLLHQIDRATLQTMLLYLRVLRLQYLSLQQNNSSLWAPYEDILSLSIFKLNEPYFSKKCKHEILKKLASIMMKSPNAIKKRFRHFQMSQFQIMLGQLQRFKANQLDARQIMEGQPQLCGYIDKPAQSYLMKTQNEVLDRLFNNLAQLTNRIRDPAYPISYCADINQLTFSREGIRMKLERVDPGKNGLFKSLIRLLNQITDRDLERFLKFLQDFKEWFKWKLYPFRLFRKYNIYDDLLILSYFKIHEDALSIRNYKLIKMQLGILLQRDPISVKCRLFQLCQINSDLLLQAVERRFDITIKKLRQRRNIVSSDRKTTLKFHHSQNHQPNIFSMFTYNLRLDQERQFWFINQKKGLNYIIEEYTSFGTHPDYLDLNFIITPESLGQVSKMIIKCKSQAQQQFSVERSLLDQISEETLIKMVKLLQQNKSYYFRSYTSLKCKKRYHLFEDIMILAYLKMNHPVLNPFLVNLIGKKITKIINRPLIGVRTRINLLNQLKGDHLVTAINNNLNLYFHVVDQKCKELNHKQDHILLSTNYKSKYLYVSFVACTKKFRFSSQDLSESDLRLIKELFVRKGQEQPDPQLHLKQPERFMQKDTASDDSQTASLTDNLQHIQTIIPDIQPFAPDQQQHQHLTPIQSGLGPIKSGLEQHPYSCSENKNSILVHSPCQKSTSRTQNNMGQAEKAVELIDPIKAEDEIIVISDDESSMSTISLDQTPMDIHLGDFQASRHSVKQQPLTKNEEESQLGSICLETLKSQLRQLLLLYEQSPFRDITTRNRVYTLLNGSNPQQRHTFHLHYSLKQCKIFLRKEKPSQKLLEEVEKYRQFLIQIYRKEIKHSQKFMHDYHTNCLLNGVDMPSKLGSQAKLEKALQIDGSLKNLLKSVYERVANRRDRIQGPQEQLNS